MEGYTRKHCGASSGLLKKLVTTTNNYFTLYLINFNNMIFGIGTDLIDVERVMQKMEKKDGFKELVFSAEEILYCEARKFKYEHYSARFAAKESFLKAIGTGWSKGTAFNEIEIYNNEQGKPELRFQEKNKKTVEGLQAGKIFVSLSHTKTMASAMVIIEKL